MIYDPALGQKQILGPLLDALRNLGGSGTPTEVTNQVASELNVPAEVLDETLPSGEGRFRNSVRWARYSLDKQGYLESKGGKWNLTPKGLESHLDLQHAKEIIKDSVSSTKKNGSIGAEDTAPKAGASIDDVPPPDEGYRTHMLDLLNKLEPTQGFQVFIRDLLRKMGFEEAESTGKSGDGGIDGFAIWRENDLIPIRTLFQCKRYAGNPISAGEIRNFRGALVGKFARGIFFTTGVFTKAAQEEARKPGADPMELIDGDKLLTLLEKHEFGLKPKSTYEVDSILLERYPKDPQKAKHSAS